MTVSYLTINDATVDESVNRPIMLNIGRWGAMRNGRRLQNFNSLEKYAGISIRDKKNRAET